MKFTTALFFFAASACAAELEQRDATASGYNMASLSSALAHLNPTTTASANFDAISPPPKNLIPEILSVVPITVIWELIDPHSRSSLASQFSAGTTPAWYKSLPTDVRSYMSVVSSQIAAGALSATTTAPTVAATGPTQTATGSTSTSSGMAARPTALTASVVGALGVLGLALAL